MNKFPIPGSGDVTGANDNLFAHMERVIGFVPNIYAVFAHSARALPALMCLEGMPSVFNEKEKTAVNLVVSQVNGCRYSLSAHTQLAIELGLTELDIMEIRSGFSTLSSRIDALVKLAQSIAVNRGWPGPGLIAAFFREGYSKAALMEMIVLIGASTITNYAYAITQVPIDFPVAPALSAVPSNLL